MRRLALDTEQADLPIEGFHLDGGVERGVPFTQSGHLLDSSV